ncbi:MAG TPA: hypothetical protein VF008_02545 [Niastella sp.]
MEYLESDIIDLICDYGGIYANSHGVSIATGINNNLLIASHIRKEDAGHGESLEYFMNEHSIANFIMDFKIGKAEDIGYIQPATLQQLYEQGKALLVCDIGDPDTYPLSFRKVGNSMVVIDHNDNIHPLPIILTAPNDFIQHTRYYFEFIERVLL